MKFVFKSNQTFFNENWISVNTHTEIKEVQSGTSMSSLNISTRLGSCYTQYSTHINQAQIEQSYLNFH